MAFPPHIQRLIDTGYRFNFGDYISRSFDIVKQEIGPFAGFILIYAIAQGIANAVPIIGGLATSLFVNPCMVAGLYLYARRVDDREPREFGNFFDGFQHWKELVVVALVQFALGMALMTVIILLFGLPSTFLFQREYIFSYETGFSTSQILLVFVLMLPVIYLSVAWIFAPLLVIFHGMRGWEALEASRQIISRNWFSMFGLLIVAGIIGILGILGLVIALLFTIPVAMVIVYTSFRDIVGIERKEQDEILDHFIV